ncbi:hypothetical protein Tco_1167690 [Tanacetum coccineum]
MLIRSPASIPTWLPPVILRTPEESVELCPLSATSSAGVTGPEVSESSPLLLPNVSAGGGGLMLSASAAFRIEKQFSQY